MCRQPLSLSIAHAHQNLKPFMIRLRNLEFDQWRSNVLRNSIHIAILSKVYMGENLRLEETSDMYTYNRLSRCVLKPVIWVIFVTGEMLWWIGMRMSSRTFKRKDSEDPKEESGMKLVLMSVSP